MLQILLSQSPAIRVQVETRGSAGEDENALSTAKKSLEQVCGQIRLHFTP
jgi:hypothetical protein